MRSQISIGLIVVLSAFLFHSCAWMMNEYLFHKDETQECILYENDTAFKYYSTSGGFYDRAYEKCQEDLTYYEETYPSDYYYCECESITEEENVCDGTN